MAGQLCVRQRAPVQVDYSYKFDAKVREYSHAGGGVDPPQGEQRYPLRRLSKLAGRGGCLDAPSQPVHDAPARGRGCCKAGKRQPFGGSPGRRAKGDGKAHVRHEHAGVGGRGVGGGYEKAIVVAVPEPTHGGRGGRGSKGARSSAKGAARTPPHRPHSVSQVRGDGRACESPASPPAEPQVKPPSTPEGVTAEAPAAPEPSFPPVTACALPAPTPAKPKRPQAAPIGIDCLQTPNSVMETTTSATACESTSITPQKAAAAPPPRINRGGVRVPRAGMKPVPRCVPIGMEIDIGIGVPPGGNVVASGSCSSVLGTDSSRGPQDPAMPSATSTAMSCSKTTSRATMCVVPSLESLTSTDCTASPQSEARGPPPGQVEGPRPEFSFVKGEGDGMELSFTPAVPPRSRSTEAADDDVEPDADAMMLADPPLVRGGSAPANGLTGPPTPEGLPQRPASVCASSVPASSPTASAASSQTAKRKKSKAKVEADPFQCDGAHVLTVKNRSATALDSAAGSAQHLEFDLFSKEWTNLDSYRNNFTIGAKGAVQSSYLILDQSSRPHAQPKPVYHAPADPKLTSGFYGVQYDELRITSERLGSGAQGSVLKCFHKERNRPMALKKINIGSYKKDQTDQLAQMQVIEKELTMLFAHHESPHLVKVYNAYYRAQCLLILFEYVHYSLTSVLHAARAIPPEDMAKLTQRKYGSRRPKYTPIAAAGRLGSGGVSRTDSFDTPLTVLSRSSASGVSFNDSITSPARAGVKQAPAACAAANTRKPKKGKPPRADTPMPEKVVATIGRQCVEGLKCLHNLPYGKDRGLVHKDIKPGNILITLDGVVKLADFGCCSVVDPCGAVPQTPLNTGTAAYMSPERLRLRGSFGPPADIWALGVTLYEMALGSHPIPDLAHATTVSWLDPSDIKVPKPPKTYSDELREVITRCLEVDPTKRPTAEELLELPFFNTPEAVNKSALANWLKVVTNYEDDQRSKEAREERERQGQIFTKHAQAKGGVDGRANWERFRRDRLGFASVRNACGSTEEYPPLGTPLVKGAHGRGRS